MLDERYLTPKIEGQQLTLGVWSTDVPEAWKWNFWEEIRIFKNRIERDQATVCLVYIMGLRHFVSLLPPESRNALRLLVNADDAEGLSS